METENLIINMLKDEDINYYGKSEKLILIMLEDYLKKQEKSIDLNVAYRFMNTRFELDAFLIDGIDDKNGPIAVEFKKNCRNMNTFRRIIDRFLSIHNSQLKIDSFILLVLNEFHEDFKVEAEHCALKENINIYIWDINKIVEICSANYSLFVETYNNLNDRILKDKIINVINTDKDNKVKKREENIIKLHNEYINDNLVLFLGAGVSIDAKLVDWNALISQFYVIFIDQLLNENKINMSDEDKKIIINEIIKQNGESQLIQASFLSSGFKNDFEKHLSEILYRKAENTSLLLEEIGQLCISNRGKVGIQAIVNYNFDDLIEKNLQRLRVEFDSIYSDGMVPEQGKLGIYHVHGFIPQNIDEYDNLTKSLLVLSEDGYNKLVLDPYNWANISQLNFLINNTCIFIGHSITDPNLRRLLSIVNKKGLINEGQCRHYAIFKRFKISKSDLTTDSNSIRQFEAVNESVQEEFFKQLGINLIWVEEYNEIPKLLNDIKRGI